MSQHNICSAKKKIYRLSRLVLLAEPLSRRTLAIWHSVALHDRVGNQFDGLKGAEENERELSVPCFSLRLPNWSKSTVEEKLWPSIPHKAFSTEIHVCFD
jgi:hypothetical protein